MAMKSKAVWAAIVGLIVVLGGIATPAHAQVDFTGQWAPLYQEDTIERVPGPELGPAKHPILPAQRNHP